MSPNRNGPREAGRFCFGVRALQQATPLSARHAPGINAGHLNEPSPTYVDPRCGLWSYPGYLLPGAVIDAAEEGAPHAALDAVVESVGTGRDESAAGLGHDASITSARRDVCRELDRYRVGIF